MDECLLRWNYTDIESHIINDKCPPNFDGFNCWPPILINTSVSLPCPPDFLIIENDVTFNDSVVTRYCNANFTWDAAQYAECLSNYAELYSSGMPILNHLKAMYYIYWIGYTVSFVVLLTSLAIFIKYRSLWCLRNIIHSNLILCFACQCATWIAYSTIVYEIIMKHFLYESVKYCFIATILLKYFVTAGFFWMFVEGLYLLVSVRFSFQTHFINYTMCAIIGWGIPMLLVIISSVTRKKIPHDSCWNEPSKSDYIFLGPIVFILIVNLFILLVVLKVLIKQLKVTVFKESEKMKKIAKGLFVLCPLLGTTYIFTLIPPQHPPWLKLTFSYSTTVLTSTQGIVIAVLFCFSHSEVLFCIKKSCSQFMEKWRLRQSNCYIKLFDSLSEGIKETTC
ncbi:Corticotropin-releasing factor receptor 1 [Trichinella pseudospiralis]|uniref:Corticotropin-releasing factor receptor 1 n=1 Tax=Trichinella pseudospiralis TaxID=6337 RepID=A0A0V1K237_TRIPS|nr:Corticotropin-releasing factor receptor 1 [Trichinella pseudospiralis]KRZ41294.1 Corticotropin-releasing factor receptor 1 [Trichinella pseudospiralis]KRZ41296.1 Corticotropin-releasing factor receptor 1 [Trichinella pseudospiralis]